jgi:uncharacterized protein
MRTRLLPLAVLCLCGALLSACASLPSHEEIQAAFAAGLKAYDAGDYRTAYETWQEIEDVDLAALRNIAVMLRKGQGVEKDAEAAREKMELAAQAGLVTAQADLADMLIKGEGGHPDPKAAIPWLTSAA